MRISVFGIILLSIGQSVAAPVSSSSNDAVTVTRYVDSVSTAYDWTADWQKQFAIHNSCNNTQFNQLSQAFDETRVLAAHARDHTVRFSNESEIYRRYFGDAPSGEVIGIYENIVNGDKTGVLFRCDDIDGNCQQDGWAGHWRGENGTDETVICDLSYTTRKFLPQLCSGGYTVSKSSNTAYWASDLLHRIWHTTKMGQNVVGHYADTYDECLELAQTNQTESVRNSATLRYYALDVYAYDISLPGVGCNGADHDDHDHDHDDHDHDESSSTSSDAATTTEATKTEETHAGTECHTHSNGETHCA